MLSEYGYELTDKLLAETWELGEYKIVHGESGGGTFSKDSSQAVVTYLCEYFYFEKFIDVVLGKTVKVGSELRRSKVSGTFDDLNGSLPEPHPYLFNFFASSAELVPMGTPEQNEFGPLWQKAKINVVFRAPTYNVLADDGNWDTEVERFVTKTSEGQSDFQTTSGFFKFVSTGRVLDITPGFVVPATRMTYTWHQIPVTTTTNGNPQLGRIPNLSTVLPLQGSLNSTEFDGYPPGTVLFVTYIPKLVLPQVATEDNYAWDVAYALGVRDMGASATPVVANEHIGWNYAYDPLQGAWDLYTTDGTTVGGTQYQYADLNNLFAVNW